MIPAQRAVQDTYLQHIHIQHQNWYNTDHCSAYNIISIFALLNMHSMCIITYTVLCCYFWHMQVYLVNIYSLTCDPKLLVNDFQ